MTRDHDADDSSAPAVSQWAELGLLTGPLIHEIRNDLNVIALQVNILRRKLPEELRSSLDVATRSVSHSAMMLDFLRARMDQIPLQSTPLDLVAAIRRMMESFPEADGAEVVHLALDVPKAKVVTVQRLQETLVWLRLTTHCALSMADPTNQGVVIRLARDTLAWSLTPRSACSTAQTFAISKPNPLHPLELALLDSIPRRAGFRVEGKMSDGAVSGAFAAPPTT